MAELACVYDAAPVPRTPEDIISTPARKKKAQAGKAEGRDSRGSRRRRQVADRVGHYDIPGTVGMAVICFRWISSPPTMGIVTSSSSGGARSAPREMPTRSIVTRLS